MKQEDIGKLRRVMLQNPIGTSETLKAYHERISQITHVPSIESVRYHMMIIGMKISKHGNAGVPKEKLDEHGIPLTHRRVIDTYDRFFMDTGNWPTLEEAIAMTGVTRQRLFQIFDPLASAGVLSQGPNGLEWNTGKKSKWRHRKQGDVVRKVAAKLITRYPIKPTESLKEYRNRLLRLNKVRVSFQNLKGLGVKGNGPRCFGGMTKAENRIFTHMKKFRRQHGRWPRNCEVNRELGLRNAATVIHRLIRMGLIDKPIRPMRTRTASR